MSGQIENLITRYEEDIKLHDCQQWEKQLEEDPTLDINDATRKKTRHKMELLDVDLVRGSTFPKSKTRHDLSSILCYSVISVILFPLRASWWIKKTSIHCYIVGSLVYSSSLLNVYLYHSYLCPETDRPAEVCSKVNIHEVYEPLILLIVLALLQCHIVSPLKYRNLDILDDTQPRTASPVTRSQKRRKSSTSEKSKAKSSSRSNSTARSYQKVRKLSIRRNVQPSNILDSWHENSTSCTDNEEHETNPATAECHQDNESFMKQVNQNTSQTSEDQDSDGAENNLRRKLSKQRLYGVKSEGVSSSAEDSHSKQSSPIVLQIGKYLQCPAPGKSYLDTSKLNVQHQSGETCQAVGSFLRNVYVMFMFRLHFVERLRASFKGVHVCTADWKPDI